MRRLRFGVVLLVVSGVLLGCQDDDGKGNKKLSEELKYPVSPDKPEDLSFSAAEMEDTLSAAEGPLEPYIRAQKTRETEYAKKSFHATTKKVMVAGDSWAFLGCIFGSMGFALHDEKSKLVMHESCLQTSRIGAEARDWESSSEHRRVTRQLKADPSIKVVYLSLGGNDMLSQWKKSTSESEELAMFSAVYDGVLRVANQYLSLRPDIQVVISGYDYPFFRNDTRISMYRKAFRRMQEPLPEQINRGLVRYNRAMVGLEEENPRIQYIHHLGLAHYHEGVCSKGISPGVTLPPDQISSRHDPLAHGGDIREPACGRSYLNLIIDRDSFHMSPRRYLEMARHSIRNVLSKLTLQ
jgi:hypothetical protein